MNESQKKLEGLKSDWKKEMIQEMIADVESELLDIHLQSNKSKTEPIEKKRLQEQEHDFRSRLHSL
jgi:hypothetical protein